MIMNTNEIRIPMFNISVIEHGKRLIKPFERLYYLIIYVYKTNYKLL